MNELALFAGAGGGLLGTRLLGFRPVCAVELDPYRREVLLRRQEEGHLEPFPVWDDIRSFDGQLWRGKVDIVTAGFPCQRFSTASRGRPRAADLWGEVERILAEVRPTWLLTENVLACAYPPETRPFLWRGCPSFLGAGHRRPREWLFAHSDDSAESTKSLNAALAGVPPPGPLAPWAEGPGRILGMDDGVAHRVDRLRALGDGQVPAVVVRAWEILTK